MATIRESDEIEAVGPDYPDEYGSAYGYDDLFAGYESGQVFTYDDARIDDFRDMLDKDGKAAGVEKLLSYPIISASKEVVPHKNDRGEAEFIEDMLENMDTSIDELIAQMTFAFTIKRQYFEKVRTVRNGKLVYTDVAWRPPETCELALDARTGRYEGFRQLPMLYGTDAGRVALEGRYSQRGWLNFPPHKAFVYVHGRWRDPIVGMSGMQIPYWCYVTKQKLRYLWYQYLETAALPKTVVRNEDERKARAAAKEMAKMKARATLGLQSDNEWDILETSGKGGAQFEDAIRFLDSEMSQSVLGGFMDLTQQSAAGKGSYALSQDQSKLYLRTRQFVASDMSRQIERQLFAPLIELNFGRKAGVPSLEFGPLSDGNEQQVLELFAQIATTGANVSEDFYMELTARVAALLELDTRKVREDIEVTGAAPLNKLIGTVDNATEAVRSKRQREQQERQGQSEAGAIGGARGVVPPNAIRQSRPQDATTNDTTEVTTATTETSTGRKVEPATADWQDEEEQQ